ncbi:MAG TPA: hypothetical protein VHV77_14795 [Pirellulales bacterium]|jgi:hypothetical protein|nr:hypothetical protein [Pirellulales bacterium]
MLYPHSIRLRGPWQYAVESENESDQRASLPDEWREVLAAAGGRKVRLRRSFNRPTRLESHESVWLLVDAPLGLDAIALNAEALEAGSGDKLCLEFEITDKLAGQNTLEIAISGACAGETTPWSDVRLEVRLKD